jgi:hypothetical protein
MAERYGDVPPIRACLVERLVEIDPTISADAWNKAVEAVPFSHSTPAAYLADLRKSAKGY